MQIINASDHVGYIGRSGTTRERKVLPQEEDKPRKPSKSNMEKPISGLLRVICNYC